MDVGNSSYASSYLFHGCPCSLLSLLVCLFTYCLLLIDVGGLFSCLTFGLLRSLPLVAGHHFVGFDCN
ncbi:hypothetical protein EQ871_00845 [Enterococcus casseliflavus]|nr:hypothetical protein [Enterococcus casseliflavus]MBO6366763.1 hypothetical protein [Enterococcus casseliflavus]MRI70649.1 hypothetical protein [Enterococcus casseliflavus]RXA65691.1 hypothetical protein EQ871_00845 [Enterococcus casseliflavus]